MPSRRKRKVDEGEVELSPNPPKKSKYSKAEKAAARERARAWHQNKNNGKSAGVDPRFSTGRASVADKSPTPTKAMKRMTPSTSRSAGRAATSTRSRKTTPNARASRSSLEMSPDFKFEPPEVKSERGESEKNEGEENNAMTIDPTAEGNESTKRTHYDFGKSDESEAAREEKASKKQKKAQQRARLEKLRAERQQKGLKVASPIVAKIGSPDPPSSEKGESLAMARRSGASKTGSTKRKKIQPAAEVAGLIVPSSKPKSSAHQPNRGTFNPNSPFPTEGHDMLTAGHYGCGPTPGSPASPGRGDICRDENARMKLDRDTGSGMDPPCARNDGQQVSTKPSPPRANSGSNGASGQGAETDPLAAVRPRQQPSSAFSSAVARAKMLVSSATSANAERRGRLGVAVFGDREETVVSVDPPAASSNVSETLAKFRIKTDGAEPEEKEECTKIDTVAAAGQNTSELGDNHRVDETSNSDLTEETPKQKSFLAKSWTLMKTVLIGIMAIQIVWFLLMAASGRIDTSPKERSADDAIEGVENSCFIDYPAGDFDAGEDIQGDDASCVGKYIQCPLWGICRGGELVDCNDGGGKLNDMVRFVVSSGGDSCVPSDETKILSLAVEEALLSMSASQTCGEAYQQGEIRVDQDNTYPLFSLSRVVDYMATLDRNDAISLDTLLWAYPAFDETVIRFGSLSGSDNFDAVGLGGGVSPSALNLPLHCQTKLLLWELLGYLISALYFLGRWLVSFSFNHPYVSAVLLATAKLTSIFQRKRMHRRRVHDLFEPVKEQAYDLLAESMTSEGYAALLLRDDVTHIMFSNNVDREFVNAFVWPKVVHDVRRDNRVRKFRKHHGGKELEHWELARVSALSRKARKSGSTPVPAPENLLAASTAPRDPPLGKA